MNPILQLLSPPMTSYCFKQSVHECMQVSSARAANTRQKQNAFPDHCLMEPVVGEFRSAS